MKNMLMRVPLLIVAFALLTPGESLLAQSEERSIYASVADKSNAPVKGLSAKEFVVREDEVAREVLRVSTALEPLQVALLVDTSQAIEPHLLDLRTGLRAFFKQVGGEHEVALIGFGERPTVLSDYTRDAGRLEKALGSVFARRESGTYLMEAVMEASSALRRRKAVRPHVIVVTARGPEFSERHHDQVLESLRESGVTLHTLVINKPGMISTERSDQELELTIAEGTRLTGGRRDDLLTSMAIGERLQSLWNELINQYEVTYARTKTLIPPKGVEVTVKRPEVTVRARRWS
jgi:Ca-activated chloride channel family protein